MFKPWTSSKKRKQRRTNENTSMGEEAKVRHADEAIVIVNGGQIFVVREKKGSVKISELDSNNRDADRDSSDESEGIL